MAPPPKTPLSDVYHAWYVMSAMWCGYDVVGSWQHWSTA